MKLLRLEERFWPNVRKSNGCWEWTGPKEGQGYGAIYLKAHIVSYELLVGEVPRGVMVFHRCDNPGCVNPDHLYLGNHSDNAKDAYRNGKKLRLYGKKKPATKLSDDEVKGIRRKYHKEKVSQASLGKEYGVTQAQISRIVRAKVWKQQ